MRTVLLAVPDHHDLELFRAFLSRSYCRFLTASTIAEIIELITTEQIDAIVTTLIDPGFLALGSKVGEIPVVLVTAAEVDKREVGATDVVTRPVNEEKFLSVLRSVVDLPPLREPRVATNLSCLCQIDHRNVPVRIVDLSRGGALLKSVFPLPGDESRLSVALELSIGGFNRRYACPAVVVRRLTETQVGVRFVNMSDEAVEAIQQYMDEVRQEAFEY